MKTMNVQLYHNTGNNQKTSTVSIPSFRMAKTKVPKDVVKQTAEIGTAILTTGVAAVTGEVVAKKSAKQTVKELSSECANAVSCTSDRHEMTKAELQAKATRCETMIKKCNNYLSKKQSPTIEMCHEYLEDAVQEINQQLASLVYMDICEFFDKKIEPTDVAMEKHHIDYSKLNQDELDSLKKDMTELMEDCDKYGDAKGSLRDSFDLYSEKLEEELIAIEYVPKLKNMSFDEAYTLYDGSGSVLDEAVFNHLMDNHFGEFQEKQEQIKKKCVPYELGRLNYLRATGNEKLLIEKEMTQKYGLNFVHDVFSPKYNDEW